MKLKDNTNYSKILNTLLNWLSQVNSFEKSKKRNIDCLESFWKSYWYWINKLIDKKLISRSNFDIIKEWFNNLAKVYNRSEWNYIWDNLLFRKICSSFLRLSFQFNEYDDNHLIFFNPSSSYYKRIKALLLVRWFRWTSQEFLNNFTNITKLLFEIIEHNPENQKYCIDLGVDCLNILFSQKYNSWNDSFLNTTLIEKFNIIVKYCDKNFINIFLRSNDFKKWMVWEPHKNDDKENSEKWIKEILDSIVMNAKLNDKDQKEAYIEIDKYIKIYSDTLKIEKSVNKWFINFLKANNYYNWNNVDSLNWIDVNEIYEKVKSKYFWDLIEDRDFHVCNSEDANDMRTYFGTLMINSEIINTKNLVAFVDEQPKEKLEEIKNDLEQLDGFEFLVFNMPKDLRILFNMNLLQKDNNLWNIWCIVDFCVNIYLLINKLKSKYPDEITEDVEVRKSDIKDVERLLFIIEEKDKLLHEKEKAIERYIQQSIILQNQIDNINEKLKKHGINFENDDNQQCNKDLLIEKRSYYRIIVVWWSSNSIWWFKTLMKNNLYVERLNKYYYLNVKQFELKWTYDMQKDKKFSKQIQDWLDFWLTDFVIVLQSDHATALNNLINDPYYSARITYFWELDEEWKISKINQKFSPEKFDFYLEKALKKYEKMNDINSNLLDE